MDRTTSPDPSSIRSWSNCSRTSAWSPSPTSLPAPARVSEPALPLLLAALHEQLGGRSSACSPTMPTRATPPRPPPGSSATTQVALLPSRGVHWGSGPRAAAAPRRRARARARRPRRRRARLRLRRRARRAACLRRAARPEPLALAAGRRAGPRRGHRAPRARRLRAGRPRRGARPVRRPRRARRRLPDDGPRAAPRRVLRRRDRGHPRVLAVHPARAAGRGRRDRLSGRRTPARPASSRAPRRRRGSGRSRAISCRPLDRAPDLVWRAGAGAARLGRGVPDGAAAERRGRARSVPARAAVRVRGAAPGAWRPGASRRPRTSWPA